MLNIGQILQGRYHIIKELGRGGFGAVYEAVEIELKTTCVIKQMLPPDDPALAITLSDQFLREAQTLATLRHSNLPRVTHHFVEEGNYYLVMDFVAGKSMEKLIGDAGLAEDVVLGYADQLLGVLEYIHARGIIHRDIKPANIIVQPDGKVMLVDFGLVKNTVAGGTSMHALSAYYAPPEQYTGGTDQCSDLFSLAATLYQALTGKLPATATDRSAGAPLIPIPQYRAGISDRTVRVITKALTLNRIGRYRTAAEMRSELMNVNGKHGISVNVRAIASVGMIFALIAIACVVIFLLVNIPPPPPPVATTVPLPTITKETITAKPVVSTFTPVPPTPTYNIPTATPMPSSTPAPTAPAVFFEEHFSDNTLDTSRWNIENSGGSIRLGGGLKLSSSTGIFPYIRSTGDVFPIDQDYRLDVKFRFVNPNACGVGILVTTYKTPVGVAPSQIEQAQYDGEQNGFTTGVWEDATQGMRVWFRTGSNRREEPIVDTRFNAELHQLSIEYSKGIYTLYLDREQYPNPVYTSVALPYHAQYITFGHPALVTTCAGYWTGLEVDSVTVNGIP